MYGGASPTGSASGVRATFLSNLPFANQMDPATSLHELDTSNNLFFLAGRTLTTARLALSHGT
jgi:hypothetical protein